MKELIESADSAYAFVAEVEWVHEPSRFDLTRVYRHKPSGAMFYATDAGPIGVWPFTEATTDELRPIKTADDWDTHVASRVLEVDPASEFETPKSAVDSAAAAAKSIRNSLRV